MHSVRRTATVPYSAAQMFTLVSDIESYPEFLHWCRDARVTKRGEKEIEATVDIGIRGLHRSFSTRNPIEEPRRIGVHLVSGPFRYLSGEWRFDAQQDGSCIVSLDLDFEVSRSPFGRIFEALFDEVARSQMGAFLKRADELYG
jgi:ribosome-associated toxin RatA of RatAB toxin-antitoxin module